MLLKSITLGSSVAITKEDIQYLEEIDRMEPSANCLRAQIACIIVKNKKVLVKHANDWLPEYNCKSIGCIRNDMNLPSGHRREICHGVCAEMWAIAEAAEKGISLKGTTLYCTKYPCRICASLIAISGIKRVVYQEGYPDVIPYFNILKDRGVTIEQGPSTDFKDPKTSKSYSI